MIVYLYGYGSKKHIAIRASAEDALCGAVGYSAEWWRQSRLGGSVAYDGMLRRPLCARCEKKAGLP